jgi:peptidoglycan/xylan/chitin deacetylase (PgdA/CDA1 family)
MSVKRLERLIVSLCFYPVSEAWRLLLRLLGRATSGTAVVFYYHHVEQEHRGRFARQMRHLLRCAEPIRADHSSPLRPRARYAAVTFDDGFPCVLESAVPELERLKIPATLFVIAGRLGTRPECDPSERCVTADELRQAASSDLIAVGSHSLTHPRMTAMAEPEARKELCESRERLREIVGRDAKLFCFPFGSYDETVVRWCREAGYDRVFTVEEHLAFSDPREFVTGRVDGEPTDSLLEFHLKLMGAYRWVPWVSRVKRMIVRNGSA